MISRPKPKESPWNAVLGLAQNFILSRVLMIFAELKLGALLANGPLHLNDIASSLKVHPLALKRFLRLLTAHHIVKDNGKDFFVGTPMSEYFDLLIKENLIGDYENLAKAIDSMKSNTEALYTNLGNEFIQILKKYQSQCPDTPKGNLLMHAHEFIASKVIMCAAELKLGELLAKETYSIETLASKLKVPADIVKPFIQILVENNIIEVTDESTLKNTPLSECFDRILSPHVIDGYQVFNGASHTLKQNTGSWEHVFEKSFYDYLNQDSRKLQMFKEWCLVSAIDWLPPILSFCQFPNDKTIIDIAGGAGHFLSSVLRQNPHMDGVLFEQPSILDGAKASPLFKGLEKRTRFEGGDFFKKIPTGGEIYTICRTLLNWSDEQSIEILNNCHKAMAGKGKLWIIDFMVPENKDPKYPRSIINDISLFVIFNSAIRTESEWRKLLAKTLFSVSKIYVTNNDSKPEPFYPMSIIEAISKEILEDKQITDANKTNHLSFK
jgi:hypothetical protein